MMQGGRVMRRLAVRRRGLGTEDGGSSTLGLYQGEGGWTPIQNTRSSNQRGYWNPMRGIGQQGLQSRARVDS